MFGKDIVCLVVVFVILSCVLLRYRVRRGTRIRLPEDVWEGLLPLCIKFSHTLFTHKKREREQDTTT